MWFFFNLIFLWMFLNSLFQIVRITVVSILWAFFDYGSLMNHEATIEDKFNCTPKFRLRYRNHKIVPTGNQSKWFCMTLCLEHSWCRYVSKTFYSWIRSSDVASQFCFGFWIVAKTEKPNQTQLFHINWFQQKCNFFLQFPKE